MRVFISHGTDKTSAQELAFLDGLQAGLGAPGAAGPGPEVLLDRTRLEAGDDWAGVLHDWLADCHAAVLLLSPRALARPWVLKEATILAYRQAIDPRFVLLPVLLPGVDAQAFARHPNFLPLALKDIQAVSGLDDPAAVAARLRARLDPIDRSSSTPLDRLERVLEAQIQQADTPTLELACNTLLGELVPWRPGPERRRQCARVVARAIVRGRLGGPGALPGLARTLKEAALAGERILHVAKMAAPSWVDEELGLRLRTQVQAAPAVRRLCALNSSRVRHGALMAVWRTQLPQVEENVYWVAGGGADDWADELPARICAAYRRRGTGAGRQDDGDDADDEDSDDDLIADLARRSEPVFFVLPPPLPDAALHAALQQQFPKAVFIAHTGATLGDDLPAHVLPLLPGLAAEQEQQSRADYQTVLREIV